MPERAFPVVYARDVERSARFYQRLVLQPHLLFASLIVCAAGAGLVAPPPS
jgi:hypothetical protein